MTQPQSRSDESIADLVRDMSTQTSRLVRDELRLAQAELTQKGKRAGIGVGELGGAGLLALYGLGALFAAIIAALALVMDTWLAALIVAVVLFAIAAVLAVAGKKQVQKAVPPVPEHTVENVKADIAEVKEARSHEH
ncbi:phage holin family protein [Mumia zhuanghuii]|uniref:Phage holin family protein n=2 Tax=Mumia TaxID=1546255 RepID=A0ABW1QJA8_9ACTN|nr:MULTISPECIES: phage holin family protein [Mumia]KAA1425399.1 phage holin family protein [Mumia zhuanghuii]